jgi:hypothetical protein
MKQGTVVLLLFVLLARPVAAAELPSNTSPSFGSTGMSLSDVQPGARVAWMTLTRERVAYHSKLRIQRGLEVADASGTVAIAQPGVDESRSLWLAAAIDDTAGLALDAASPGYAKSVSPIHTVAAVGATGITIESRQVEIIYVRRNVGAWFLSAMDGELGDQDDNRNAVITISMQSLEPFEGNPSPPASVAAGDIILILDPYNNRTSMLTVSQ